MISYTEKELKREWELIKQSNNGYESGYFWNKIVKHFQWKEFYKEELKLLNSNPIHKGLPLKSWLYANRLKYLKKDRTQLTFNDLLRAFKISGIYIGYSFHSPFYIKQFIKDYSIKSIYDPCGGWGHRLIGAKSINCFYIYNDINTNTLNNCKNIADFLDFDIPFYNYSSDNFTPEEDYTAVFTCPPYYNTEIYTNKGAENLSYDKFKEWWSNTIKMSCINKVSCQYFAFVINHIYEKDMTNICTNLGLTKISEHILGSTEQISHLRLNTNKYEKLIVLSK